MFSVSPQIIPFTFGSEPINSGDMTSLTCTVQKGDLPMNISWTFNGNPINKNAEGISVIKTNKRISQLSIESVNAELAGEYNCVAENDAGVSSHSSTLYVNGTNFFKYFFDFNPISQNTSYIQPNLIISFQID